MTDLRGAPARRTGLLIVLAFAASAPVARAATITVTTTSDAVVNDGACSLREAVTAANTDTAGNGCPAGSGADTIVLTDTIYNLTRTGSDDTNVNGDLDITSPVTVQHAGGLGYIEGGISFGDRVLDVHAPAVVTLDHIEISLGSAPAGTDAVTVSTGTGLPASSGAGGTGADGGGIRNTGTLTLANSVVTFNRAGGGGDGGTANGGNGASGSGGTGGNAVSGAGGAGGRGGGVFNSGTLVITNSEISANVAGPGGSGGLANSGDGGSGAAASTGGNAGVADGGLGGPGGTGGGIYSTGPLTVTNTSITNNHAGNGGGGGDPGAGSGGNAGSGIANGGTGGFAAGGYGGAGADGGGIFADAGATITDTTISQNAAGTGGMSPAANGGSGGFAGSSGGAGGSGGSASGGGGGHGGAGGGVAGSAAIILQRVLFNADVGGSGGVAGAAGADPLIGTSGALAQGGPGGVGGNGGALAGTGSRAVSDTTFEGNASGAGTAGGTGTGATAGGNSSGAAGAGGAGGALYNPSGAVTIDRSTISSNTYGASGSAGAVAVAGGSVTVSASLFDQNEPTACQGTITDSANNLDFPDSVGCPGAGGGDPLLGQLASNGGPTKTRALPVGSPALDRYSCTGSDQRGVPRPGGALCDIGAYERATPVITPIDASGVDDSGATLNARVNPEGTATKVTFEYGTTTAYGTTDPFGTDLPAGVAAVAVSDEIFFLTANTTYHFRVRATNADGVTVGPDQVFTTTGGASGTGTGPGAGAGSGGSGGQSLTPDTTAPFLDQLAASPSTFAVARGSTAISARAKKKTTPLGTKLRFHLSEPASVTLSFARRTVGTRARVKGKTTCKATHHTPKRSLRCTVYVAAGSLTRAGKLGTNSVAFSGRVGSKPLARGSYQLGARPVDAAGNRAHTVTATFTVVAASKH